MLTIRTFQYSRGTTSNIRNFLRAVTSSSKPTSLLFLNKSIPALTTWPTRQQQRWYAATPPTSDTEKRIYDLTGWERVYYGSLTPRMRAVKIFSLTTSITGLAVQPMLMEQGMKLGGTGMAVFLCSFAGFFTFITPLLLHFVTKKYVSELHYNPTSGDYVATTVSIFLYKIHTKFQPSDVKVPDVPGMFTSFVVRDKIPFFVDPALFEDPEHYVKIMGYDKPVDFKLNLKELDDSDETHKKDTK